MKLDKNYECGGVDCVMQIHSLEVITFHMIKICPTQFSVFTRHVINTKYHNYSMDKVKNFGHHRLIYKKSKGR